MKVEVFYQVSSIHKSLTPSNRKGGMELMTLKLISKHWNNLILLIWGGNNLNPHLLSHSAIYYKMIINWSLHFISKKSKRRQKSLLILIVCTLILIQKNECGISDKYVLRISILILQSFFWFLHITPRCWRIVFHSCHFIVILPY